MSISVACGVSSVEYNISDPDTAHIIRPSALITPNSNGFTLLEVMVAVSIMALVLVTLLGLKDKTMQEVMLADHITTATLLAKRMMTDSIIIKPRLPLEDAGEFSEQEFKEYTWKKVISVTPLTQVMEVRVAVLWKEGTRQEMVELVGYE
jgi:general secretion pathway protein I